jgi:hypothetical protein
MICKRANHGLSIGTALKTRIAKKSKAPPVNGRRWRHERKQPNAITGDGVGRNARPGFCWNQPAIKCVLERVPNC